MLIKTAKKLTLGEFLLNSRLECVSAATFPILSKCQQIARHEQNIWQHLHNGLTILQVDMYIVRILMKSTQLF